MGLRDLFKKSNDAREEKEQKEHAVTMTGNSPIYNEFGNNVYASDIVMQSIRCKANEFKKLKPRHIEIRNGMKTVNIESSIAKVLQNPNPYMTTADFLEKITILLELNKNVFIYPEYYITQAGKRYYTALYPLKPSNASYLEDAKGDLYISLEFRNGSSAIFKTNEIIHWRKDFGVNDFFGGSMLGGNDNVNLLKVLKEYDKLRQSIAISLDCAYNVNGIVKVNTYMDDDSIKKEREEFIQSIKTNKSGILVTDQKVEYVPIDRDIQLVDAETLKFFYEQILGANGTSLAIYSGDYTKAQKEAYYEHALEADITSLGQCLTKVLFTDREKSFGNSVVLYPNAIEFMSMENKIAFAGIAAPGGHLLKDEFRELFGYPPLPDGQGQVISQGYNNLLDENNNNELQKDKENQNLGL